MPLPDTLSDTLAKVVGSHYIRNLKKDHAQDALAMTIKLGIITEDVSCVMVSDEVVEGADGLPNQVNIPQMTPDIMGDMPSYAMHSSASVSEPEFLDIPSFLRRSPDESPADSVPKKVAVKIDVTELLKKSDEKLSRRFNKKLPTIAQLEDWGLPLSLFVWLDDLKELHSEKYVQACIAIVLQELDTGHSILSSTAKHKLNTFIHDGFNGDANEEQKKRNEVLDLLSRR